MKVIVAKTCGFCQGVKNAIRIAEQTLTEKETVCSLGPIIHNRDVVGRLLGKGLKTIESEDAEQITSGTVLIRSHGASPEEIRSLKEKGCDIVDATCVLVKRLQKLATEMEKDGYLVVIVGDENHPEVKAVVAGCENGQVLGNKDDVKKLKKCGKLAVLCQTTQSHDHFASMIAEIAKRDFGQIKVVNTLCKEAANRQEAAVELCKNVDAMFVLGGLESANTKKLADLCKKYNNSTFHLQNWTEFDKRMVLGKSSAGITAGASTPQWVINEFAENLAKMN